MATDKRRAILRLAGPDVTENIIEVTADHPMTVGRLASCDITLKHTKVSREHSRFEMAGKGLTVQDLGSSNGTLIGGVRIDPNVPVLLNVGDTVRIGPFTLLFEQIVEAGQERLELDMPSSMLRAAADEEIGEVVSQEMAAPTPPSVTPPEAPPPGLFEGERFVAPGYAPLMPAQRDGDGHGPPPQLGALPEIGEPAEHLHGIPRRASSLLQYLPAVYSDDDFTGRFLLIFEAIHAPLEWIVDCFYYYLDTKLTPPEWLHWFGTWVDILVPVALPEKKQRAIAAELGPLFLTRGTRGSLARHLELVFDVKPEIDEPRNRPNTFTVTLALGAEGNTETNREIATRIIESHRPIHAQYDLKIT